MKPREKFLVSKAQFLDNHPEIKADLLKQAIEDQRDELNALFPMLGETPAHHRTPEQDRAAQVLLPLVIAIGTMDGGIEYTLEEQEELLRETRQKITNLT